LDDEKSFGLPLMVLLLIAFKDMVNLENMQLDFFHLYHISHVSKHQLLEHTEDYPIISLLPWKKT
jgi:hypothetical protein